MTEEEKKAKEVFEKTLKYYESFPENKKLSEEEKVLAFEWFKAGYLSK